VGEARFLPITAGEGGAHCLPGCHWCLTGGYRGPNCGYTGPYVTKDGIVTDNPELDECDATLGKGCIPRFGEGNPLPFGGFSAVSLIARS